MHKLILQLWYFIMSMNQSVESVFRNISFVIVWKPSVKLVPNLSNKTKYVLHYRNLKLYLAYIVLEFIGLRSKMYSLKYEVILENDQGEILKYSKDKKTAKGVARAVIDKQLKHDAYRDCLFLRYWPLQQRTKINYLLIYTCKIIYNKYIYTYKYICINLLYNFDIV
jgi:hypothetical protein